MPKKISVLGATGSIGTQTLEVSQYLGYTVSALTGHRNVALLEAQIRRFQPALAVVADEAGAQALRKRIRPLKTEVLYGRSGLLEAAAGTDADLVVAALLGISGLEPVLAAIRAGKAIALANKETLVAGGALVIQSAREAGVRLLPVDSEHCAIFQCVEHVKPQAVRRLILTASGGPFRQKSAQELEGVTVAQALNHPTWNMGRKISIDSATLMNKGLEVIEAHWLFDMDPQRISVLVHPQSVVHSMAELIDGTVMAQMGPPDMRVVIQYALTWPERVPSPFAKLDLETVGPLTFEAPDTDTFRCLKLAYDALDEGGTVPAVMNGANEEAVDLFLSGAIGFMDIARLVERVMLAHSKTRHPTLEDILEADQWSRAAVRAYAARDTRA
jgi:1-deoxy-D-xylulose-5-phosphate reductoisomerase